MQIGLPGKRRFDLFPAHQTGRLIGEDVTVVIPTNAQNRLSTKVSLFNLAARVGIKILRQGSNEKFTLYFHDYSLAFT